MGAGIQYIKHNAIDKARWNRTLAMAANSLIYAHTDFLDAMSPGWDALMLGDYEFLMPLTHRRKYGIAYICQPAFAQQLGVFSQHEITHGILQQFFEVIANDYKLVEIFVNYGCAALADLPMSTNYILPLTASYETLRANYKKDLLKNLQRCSKFNLVYQSDINPTDAIFQYKLVYGDRLGYSSLEFENFEALCQQWMKTGQCIVRKVVLISPKNPDPEILSIGLFLKDQNRLYNVASTTLPNGRMMEANHFLMDQLIREFAGQDLILDFEGSDLPGVAKFYQKFNPINQPYFFWKSNRLPPWIKWLKK